MARCGNIMSCSLRHKLFCKHGYLAETIGVIIATLVIVSTLLIYWPRDTAPPVEALVSDYQGGERHLNYYHDSGMYVEWTIRK